MMLLTAFSWAAGNPHASRSLKATIVATLVVCVSTAAQAECVTVKYRDGACVPHCSIPPEKVKELEFAESVGRFYNEEVKGKFGCQGQPVPTY